MIGTQLRGRTEWFSLDECAVLAYASRLLPRHGAGTSPAPGARAKAAQGRRPRRSPTSWTPSTGAAATYVPANRIAW